MGRKLMRNFGRAEPKSLSSAVMAGCFLVTMALLLVSASYVVSFPSFSSWMSTRSGSSVPKVEEKISTYHKAEEKISTYQPDTIAQTDNIENQQRGPICDTSGEIADICDIYGDIRIHGNSSSIFFGTSNLNVGSQDSWKIRPHPRRGMPRVSEVSVKPLTANGGGPKCMINNKIPAIVFSLGGYMGNFFHDFTDVLIPLFITSRQFNGEVQFLISEMLPWWVSKYELIFKQLSNYEIIDFNQDHAVRCYSHVIVSLKIHKVLSIDPARAGGLTMVDFGRFIRKAYGLERENAIRIGAKIEKKPKLLLIARKWTRRFDNVDEIIRFAQSMGFEAAVAEMQPEYSMQKFAQIVNSGDVLLGVHGAGLTNLVFLPTNAVVIQVVPLGGLEPICWTDFGLGTIDMKINYLQYSISAAESTLGDRYPATNADYPVLTNPKAIMNRSVRNWTDIYFFEQSVRVDVNRFSSILLQALELLRER